MGECWGLAQKQNSALAPKSSAVLWKTRRGVSAREKNGSHTAAWRPFHVVADDSHFLEASSPLGPFCDVTLPWIFS